MTNHKVLAVDDEEFNLDIITDYLTEAGYEVIQAVDGVDALEKLEQHKDISVIVLDRMMPRMDGMEVLSHLKSTPKWREIPVVMQTAAATSEQIVEGIKAGVYHYLAKPYTGGILTSIVESALNDISNRNDLKEEVHKHRLALGLMENASFRFRTIEEARNLAYFVANCFPDPETIVYGLNELMINAIEHGNLGITYTEKTKLVLAGGWIDEVRRRINLDENKDKFATLSYKNSGDAIMVTIKDMGNGFDWQKYMELTPDRATDPNGRGIATSRMLSFDNLEYIGKGNEVNFTVKNRR